MTEETIAAIATAAGEGGVSIVRVSGPESLSIADRVFESRSARPSASGSHVVLHGRITAASGDIDEVLLLVMRAPHSYTREDVVEIQGHGGNVVARRILRRVLEAGARPADPGEFTRRAFLNGRIDLLQAEAVLDLVRSRSDRAAAAALEQLEGRLSHRFNQIYDALLSTAADLEASLDFPEDELPDLVLPDIQSRLAGVDKEMGALLDTWDEGHLLRAGLRAVISGAPNVGKSTLLNTLLGNQRAIVSPIPGTTRDTIEEAIVLGQVAVRLVDTAGLRAAECEVEEEGIRRARGVVEAADLHLYVMDVSTPLGEEERRSLEGMPSDRTIVIGNKLDLGRVVSGKELRGHRAIFVSLLDEDGANLVRKAVKEWVEEKVHVAAPPHAVISERHRRILSDAREDLGYARRIIEQDPDEGVVPAAQHLRSSLERLGEATGRVYQDDLLDGIFSRFCIGK